MHLRSGLIQLEGPDSKGAMVLRHLETQQRLLVIPSAFLMQPVFTRQPPEVTLRRIQASGRNALQLEYTCAALADFVVTIQCGTQGLDFSARFTPRRTLALARLNLFPGGTQINMYRVINFRNRHFTDETWPELPLDGLPSQPACETDTYSGDWQFAPHPTALLFQKLDLHLFCGLCQPDTSYGMYFKAQRLSVLHWYLNHGGRAAPLRLPAGAPFVTPVLRVFAARCQSPYSVYARFGRMRKSTGAAPPARRPPVSWHRAPTYCTWLDQVYASRTNLPESLLAQAQQPQRGPQEILTHDFVRQTAALIRRQRLPFKIFLIDEGWQIARGDWRPHPRRFPKFRELVDELHALGFRVVIWWTWSELADGVAVPAEQLMGGGAVNRHGRRMRDYSHPATQAYLQEQFRVFFSADRDGYNLDGIKTDFQADKAHPELPPADPSWRGEENYLLRVHQLFYEEMRRHKPEALHMGCAGNYHLARFIDLNRTYDVHSSNYREHEARARMLQATAPGVPVSYDMPPFTEQLEGYFASARRLGVAVQIGNLHFIRRDKLAPVEPANPAYYHRLRKLSAQADARS
jgi:hypothetical protein